MPRLFFVALLALTPLPSSSSPWEKPPEQWSEAEVFRILRESPWCPAKTKMEAKYKAHPGDPQFGADSSSQTSPLNSGGVGVELTHKDVLPGITVSWWSSKTIRLAQQRLRQLKHPAASTETLRVEALPDYVIAIEGPEPFRILNEPAEDLHDTVFLELADGLPLDLQSMTFVDGTSEDEARVEFHFPRQVDGRPSIEPDAPRVIFHCKATAKVSRPGRQNVLSFHSEFHPNEMRVRGDPDL